METHAGELPARDRMVAAMLYALNPEGRPIECSCGGLQTRCRFGDDGVPVFGCEVCPRWERNWISEMVAVSRHFERLKKILLP